MIVHAKFMLMLHIYPNQSKLLWNHNYLLCPIKRVQTMFWMVRLFWAVGSWTFFSSKIIPINIELRSSEQLVKLFEAVDSLTFFIQNHAPYFQLMSQIT